MRFWAQRFAGVLVAILVAGCAAPDAADYGGGGTAATPQTVVMQAADAAPDGVDVDLTFEIKGVGMDRGQLFLNSEKDYRDQRCLTLAINPDLNPAVADNFGPNPVEALTGKTVRVSGTAKRVRIDFLNRAGLPTGKYYFQTHVAITDLAQIDIR